MNRALRPVLLLGVTVLFSSGCSRTPDSEIAKNPDSPEGGLPPVKVISVTREPLSRTTTQPATVHAFYQADIHPRVAGYVKEVKADIGTPVEQDQTLCVLDLPELQKQRERLTAQIKRFRKEMESAEAQVKVAAAQVNAAKAGQELAAAELAKADAQSRADQTTLKRVRAMVADQTLDPIREDEAVEKSDASAAAQKSAKAGISAADARLAIAEAQKGAAEAVVAGAEARIAEVRKELQELDVMIDFGILKAPFKGIVTARNVDPGDFVSPPSGSRGNSSPLFTVAQTETVRVRVSVPEADAPHINSGDRAEVHLTAFPGKTIEDEVARIAGGLDASTRTMTVEIDLANSDGTFLPGMFGEVTIFAEARPDALKLPAPSVRSTEKGEHFVYVLNEGNTVHVVPVKLGRDDGTSVEIVAGLTGDEKIIDATVGRLEDGQQVSPLTN